MYYNPVQSPGQMISVDLMGPLPRSKQGATYLLVFQDCFTKWVELHPLRRATTKPIIEAFKSRILYRFGVPKILTSDNGSQFANKFFCSLAQEFGIQHRFTAPYSPQENPVERMNRVIGPMLAQYIESDQREWDRYLPEFMFAINTARHESTGYTPSMLTYGHELLPPLSIRARTANQEPEPTVTPSSYVGQLEKLKDLMTLARHNMDKAFTHQQRHYNLRRRPYRPQVNQWVYRKEHPLSKAGLFFSKKLAPKFSGPFKIYNIVSPVIVSLQDEEGRKCGTAHVKDLKPAPTP